MDKSEQIVNSHRMEWTQEQEHGERFAFKRKTLSRKSGGKNLGCSLFQVPPGKTAFPFHLHYSNEEAIYILKGKGSLRLGEKTFAVETGDYIALPVGKDHPHQLINNSDSMLEYLCLSTMKFPEVAEYPDSGKVGVMTGSAPPGAGVKTGLLRLFDQSATLDYYDGE